MVEDRKEKKEDSYLRSIIALFKSPKEVISFFLPIIIAIICVIPLPYYVRLGGGAIPLNNKIEINKEGKNGYFGALYVRETKAVVATYLISYISPNFGREKIKDVTVEEEDVSSYDYREKLYFTSSLDAATKVAYEKAGKEVKIAESKYIIIYVDKNTKSSLKVGDEILLINGEKISSYDAITKSIAAFADKGSIKITVMRDGKKVLVSSKYIDVNGEKKLGIVISNEIKYKTKPKVNFKFKGKEAGPSGGLMMTLAIYDKLIPEDITHGKKVVGTGTIDTTGKVGEIGGIKDKLRAAKSVKADIVFVPKDNYDEARKFYDKENYKFKLVSVETFDDAISFLEK